MKRAVGISSVQENFPRLLVAWLLVVSVPALVLPPSFKLHVVYWFSPRFELGVAAAQGDISSLNDALTRGANIDARDGYAGRNALMVAALHGHTKAAAFLVLQGAEIDAVDDMGFTARQLAINAKHFDTAAVLQHR